MIWSDNGSTRNFNMRLKFTKAGTFYVHAFNSGRSGYNDRTYVEINKITSGTQNLGRVNSQNTGREWNFSTRGGVQEFTVVADDIMEFKGTCRGGGNHWHGLCMHISTSATGLDICSTTNLPAPTPATGYANLPATVSPTTSYHEQQNRTANQTDSEYFVLTGSGTAEVLFDMFSGADGIEVFQGVSKGGENVLLASSGSTSLIKLTDAEKMLILNKAGGTTPSQTKPGRVSVVKDFVLTPRVASGNGVAYGAKMAFNIDIANGTYLQVVYTDM